MSIQPYLEFRQGLYHYTGTIIPRRYGLDIKALMSDSFIVQLTSAEDFEIRLDNGDWISPEVRLSNNLLLIENARWQVDWDNSNSFVYTVRPLTLTDALQFRLKKKSTNSRFRGLP